MFSSLRSGLTIFTASCLLLCACGGPRLNGTVAGPGTAPASFSVLPPPSALRCADFAPLDLRRLGAEYEHALPNAHVTDGAFTAAFAPDWQQPAGRFSDLAYAIYAFNIADFNLDPNLYVTLALHQNPTDAWIGLANFSRDRWDWFHMPADGAPLPFNQTQHMTVAGGLYAITLFTGTAPWTVDALRVGTVVAPVINAITPESGISGTQVTLQADVSGTAPFDYEWYDLAMGTPSTSSATAPVITLGAPGDYSYRLKVSNAAGSMDISRDFTVLPAPVDHWQHSWGGAGVDRAQAVAVDALGNVYVAGAALGFGSAAAAVTLKYSPVGELLWAKTWDGPSTEALQAAAIDTDGNLVLAGSTFSYGEGQDDVLLLKYAPDGTLLSQYTWGGLYQDAAVGLGFDASGNMYVAGNSASFTPSNKTGALLMKFSSGGSFEWATVWGGQSANEVTYSLAVDTAGNSFIAGSSVTYANQAFLLKCDASGGIVQQAGWQSSLPGASYFKSIALDQGTGDVYLAGDTPDGSLGAALLMRCNSSFNVQWAKTWPGNDIDRGNAVVYSAAGAIYFTGETWSHGPSPSANLFLIALNANGTLRHLIATWGIWDNNDGGTLKAEQGRALAVTASGAPVIVGSCENASAAWQTDTTTLIDVTGTVHVLDAYITPDAQIDGVLGVPAGATDWFISSGYVEDTGVGSENYAVLYGAPW